MPDCFVPGAHIGSPLGLSNQPLPVTLLQRMDLLPRLNAACASHASRRESSVSRAPSSVRVVAVYPPMFPGSLRRDGFGRQPDVDRLPPRLRDLHRDVGGIDVGVVFGDRFRREWNTGL